jgi:hypothetical protein
MARRTIGEAAAPGGGSMSGTVAKGQEVIDGLFQAQAGSGRMGI